MNRQGFLPLLLFLFLLGVVFFYPQFFWEVRRLVPKRELSQSEMDLQALRVENTYLKSELEKVKSVAALSSPSSYETAFVYSQYPFGFKKELVVNRGSEDGVFLGAVALVGGEVSLQKNGQGTVFLGTVTSTQKNTAVVKTIFDPDFNLAVRLGGKGVEGLLLGGLEPKIGFISKDATLKKGDLVITSAPYLPYGLPLARVRSVTVSADQLFQEAEIDLPYDINTLNIILVQTKFSN